MTSRSWYWLRARILGLLTRPQPLVFAGDRLVEMPANRLQASFSGQDVEQHRHTEEG